MQHHTARNSLEIMQLIEHCDIEAKPLRRQCRHESCRSGPDNRNTSLPPHVWDHNAAETLRSDLMETSVTYEPNV
jgi:hypothetical protein